MKSEFKKEIVTQGTSKYILVPYHVVRELGLKDKDKVKIIIEKIKEVK